MTISPPPSRGHGPNIDQGGSRGVALPPRACGRILLALDPSSTRCGYALMSGPETLLEAGLLKPNKTKDAAVNRIPAMAQDLAELITEVKPDEIVIEITSGHVNHGRNRGAGAGLGTYGMAVGYLWRECVVAGVGLATVEENRWTRGKRKEVRTAAITAAFPQYRPAADPGGDVADAIGLGRWFFIETGSFGVRR